MNVLDFSVNTRIASAIAQNGVSSEFLYNESAFLICGVWETLSVSSFEVFILQYTVDLRRQSSFNRE